ncbi:Cyclopropane-fatty-acyl-phospholipid synthase [Triticum urartu]|uniref:Cyclopropane-fatty-acyl-phospholipid synthase n=1 Tax=Triticum urartu TaxID=4572 RepID=M8AHV8_TRIUA|nr:Cyclopropane-fatty-acyl-phospholipid synthase [Triticum urartu]
MEWLEGLGVEMERSDMSFSVSTQSKGGGGGCEWGNGNGISSLLAQKTNILKPSFWRMVCEILKFKNNALTQKTGPGPHTNMSAGVIPVCTGMWSCSSQDVLSFSAFLALSFCRNHGLLQLFRHSQLPTVKPRSQSFVNKVKEELESIGCRIKTSCRVKSVSSLDGSAGYRVLENDGSEERYDSVILGVHAPNALKVLGVEATHHERRILGACQYVHRDIYLHCDQNLMPRNMSAWSAWNFLGTTSRGFSVTYWLNQIQKIESVRPFLVTLNPPCVPDHVLLKWNTSLPVPSVAAAKAYLDLDQIQGKRGIWFCGAYQGHGFHEDGLKSGKAAAQGLLGKKCELLLNPKKMIPSWTEAVARLLVARFFNQYISIGNLILVEEGGSVFTFGKACEKCPVKSVIRVHDPLFYWKVAIEGSIGLAEAYIDGCFSVLDKREGLLNLMLSNDFFSLFLDKSMTYSCAVFKMENESLEAAQQRKLSLLIEKAKIKRGHHVLDIGSGWGSLAIQAVKQTGCKYTGVTLSAEQHKYAERKVREAGLEDHITFLLCDYRKIPPSKYDAIISCGMIEHVGHEYMDEFFACCESYLAEDGILVLQFISIAEERYDQYRKRPDFIKEYIFPGGCLPSLARVMSAMTTSSRFSIEHVENIGPNYYTTLMHWRDNFMANKDQVLKLGFDEKFIRIWEFYLIYSAAGFKSRAVGDYQCFLLEDLKEGCFLSSRQPSARSALMVEALKATYQENSEVLCFWYLDRSDMKTYDYINRVDITLPRTVYEGT